MAQVPGWVRRSARAAAADDERGVGGAWSGEVGEGCSGALTGPRVSAKMLAVCLSPSCCPGPMTQLIWRGR